MIKTKLKSLPIKAGTKTTSEFCRGTCSEFPHACVTFLRDANLHQIVCRSESESNSNYYRTTFGSQMTLCRLSPFVRLSRVKSVLLPVAAVFPSAENAPADNLLASRSNMEVPKKKKKKGNPRLKLPQARKTAATLH